MTGSLTNAYELAVLDRLLGNQTLTPPATWYVALYTVAPADGTAGTEVSTAVWTNYARVAVTNNLTNFPSANPKTNATAISWAAATIVGAPPTVVGAALCDASTAGNQWVWFSFTGVSITNGLVFSLAAGDLSLGCD